MICPNCGNRIRVKRGEGRKFSGYKQNKKMRICSNCVVTYKRVPKEMK